MTRSILWVLLPACIVYALLLVSQGVVQNLKPYDTAKLVEPQQVQKNGADGKPMFGPGGKPVMDTVTDQTIAQGPVASQEAIKMLGTNGGGFFNANSSHPFENPTPLSNFLQMLSIFAIPGRPDLHTGPDDWIAAPRMGGLGGNGHRCSCAVSRTAYWAEAQRQPSVTRSRPTRHRVAAGRQHGRQGSALWHCRFRVVRHHHHGRELRRHQRRCTIPILHWAAWCRWSTSCSARPFSAEWARASTAS